MHASLNEIVAELDGALRAGEFEDYCPNGLQVEGRAEVEHVLTGVSAHMALLERAVELRADLVLVHHGIFWHGDSPRVIGPLRRRLELLLSEGISLVAYHLPLDAHERLGNNALLAEGLGCEQRSSWQQIGSAGHFAGDGIAPEELRRRIATLTGREPLMFASGPASVRRIAIASGAGSGHLGAAIAGGFDAFLTGEPSERVMAQAAEAGIHFIAAGHHATETFGVRAAGEHLRALFGLEHTWVDIPNPV